MAAASTRVASFVGPSSLYFALLSRALPLELRRPTRTSARLEMATTGQALVLGGQVSTKAVPHEGQERGRG